MNAFGSFFGGTAAVLAFALLTVSLLRRPLNTLLIELCGNLSRAQFWSVFTAVSLVLVAILGLLMSLPLSDQKLWAEAPLLPMILAGLRMSLAFLLAALGILATALLRAIASFEHQRQRALLAANARGAGTAS